jgi:nitroreductase
MPHDCRAQNFLSIREQTMSQANNRTADHSIDSMFIERWSPRSFTGEAMPEADLMSIFEAVRWTPSASNTQPWRFIYGTHGTAEFDKIASVLMGFNQVWAPNASALLLVVSKTQNVNSDQTVSPLRWHSYDAGAAGMAVALQAHKLGYHVHSMGGVEGEKAKDVFAIPEGYSVESAIAIGKLGPKDALPEKLQERELASPRMKVSEFAFKGEFKA